MLNNQTYLGKPFANKSDPPVKKAEALALQVIEAFEPISARQSEQNRTQGARETLLPTVRPGTSGVWIALRTVR